MLAEFAEWLETLPREKRVSIINKFVEVYATKPNAELIEGLKRQIAVRDRKIGALDSYIQELEYRVKHPDLNRLYNAVAQSGGIKEIRRHIVGAWLYKSLANENKKLKEERNRLRTAISELIYKLHVQKEPTTE